MSIYHNYVLFRLSFEAFYMSNCGMVHRHGVIECFFDGGIVIGVKVYDETVRQMIICNLRMYVCCTFFLTCF
jgi:hypothetical protein